jgi:hypothetical protein
MNSVLGEDRTWDGGGETGSENPTTEVTVAVSEELDAETALESQDFNNVAVKVMFCVEAATLPVGESFVGYGLE